MIKLIVTIILTSVYAAPKSDCSRALVNSDTGGFISYLAHLVEQRQVGERELLNLIEGIERQDTITNPVRHEVTDHGILFTKASDQIHYREMESYIQHARVDKKEILRWAVAALHEKDRVREQRATARIQTEVPFVKMEFYRVEKGSFKMGDDQKLITLKHSFEAMSTLVTQKMWVDIAGENPSGFKNGGDTIEINVNGRQVKLQPDYPVENITWWAAIVFANKLSEKMGFEPAYNLNGVDFLNPGAKGELRTSNGRVGINAPGADIYRAEGYRLPTEAELEFLFTDRGRSTTAYFTGVDESNLAEYAWYGKNSGQKTHPVAQLKPMIIDGAPFFDLIGNVTVWGHDCVGLPDPCFNRVVRGGHYDSLEETLKATDQHSQAGGSQRNFIGLRLVRTVK